MKNLTTYVFVMLMAMFWVFRIIVAFCANLGVDFMVQPTDLTFEVILLFIALVAMVLIVKRSMLGAIIYLIGYGLYFGGNLLTLGSRGLTGTSYFAEMFFSLIGLMLPIAIILDMVLDRSRKSNPGDKKTDWFYKGEQYDRKFDERADRNEYRL